MDQPVEIDTTNAEAGVDGRQPPRSVSDVVALLRAAFAREPGLSAVGAAGLVVALLCLIAVAVRGSFIPPEGKMQDAATFAFGVGVFTLTVALLLPLAGFSETGRTRWRRLFYIFTVYGLMLESIQSFRGLDPRFPGRPSSTDVGSTLDKIAGPIFGLTAALLTVLFVIFAVRFFRKDVLRDRPVLRLGIRYGVAAVVLSFGVGIIMSVIATREVGDSGNLLLAHALGVHGIQLVPAVGLLLYWGQVGGVSRYRTTWIQAAGIGWLAAGTAALVQALAGRPPLEISGLTAVIVTGVAVWAAVAGYSLMSWRRAAHA